MNISTMFLLLRNSSDCCLFAFASLPHMSICRRVIRPVTFQKVDDAPYRQTGAKSHDQNFKNVDCLIEKFHIRSSILFV